ncbi:hypothetical protein GCM10027569_55690 [Flindersiella endophytica]
MNADANRWLGEIQKAAFEAVSPEPLPMTERRGWTVRAVEALEGVWRWRTCRPGKQVRPGGRTGSRTSR